MTTWQRVEWIVRADLKTTDTKVRQALTKLGATPEGRPDWIRADLKFSVWSGRPSIQVRVKIAAHPSGSAVTCTVDTAGKEHQMVFDRITESLDVSEIEDNGLALAVSRLSERDKASCSKELAQLRTVLRADEQVKAIAQGAYKRNQALIVLTSTRLFFIEMGSRKGRKHELPVEDITSMTSSVQGHWGTLRFTVAGNTSKITMVDRKLADLLAEAFRDLRASLNGRAAPAPTVPTPQPAAPADLDVLSMLAQLGQLHEAGVLTEDEFAAKKAELLARL